MSDAETMINVVPPLPSPDPDAEATVLDFLDYTEHLHCDLARSLRLIGTLDNDYQRYTTTLNSLAITYGDLRRDTSQPQANGGGTQPLDSSAINLEALKLRVGMARKLKGALRARDEAATEATRLFENVDRHYNKLSGTLSKLQQIPLPDREPTPKPVPEGEGPPRITLRVADRHGHHPSRTPFGSAATRRRRLGQPGSHRRRVFSGGHGREDDWEDLPDGDKKRRGRRPGVGFQPKPLPPPPMTETGEPIDPKDMPWNRLLPHELARLRKRMKKNTQWTPSTTMILRELESLGRGIANKEKYMHQIESDNFPHCSPEDGGIGSLATESNLFTTENRGMKLNAAKRRLKEAQAIAASKAAAEGGPDRDTKMEDSVVVGSHRAMYGGKSVGSHVPFLSTSVPVKTESRAKTIRPQPHFARGKDPEAMNNLMMRASIPRLEDESLEDLTAVAQSSRHSTTPPTAPLSERSTAPPSVSPEPSEQESSPSPPRAASPMISPPSPPLQASKPTESPEGPKSPLPISPAAAQVDSPLSDVESPILPDSESPGKTALPSPPAAVAGHKRKRSIASSQPSPSAIADSKSEESTKSPPPPEVTATGSRKRGSASRNLAAGPASTRVTTSPKTKAETIVTPAPETKPPARRGRPPGTFKVNAASRRKNALKNAPLPKVEEKVAKSDVGDRKSSHGTSPTKKSDGDEWEEDEDKGNEEPRYCFCNGVSHGMMLGCDNDEVRNPVSFKNLPTT
ncbi:hypothetical protein DFH27DRAFT_148493 [Peziza echinospora]|nr:hypothetical protein DFH27DRAFT_148493 [Peziza echinospora]